MQNSIAYNNGKDGKAPPMSVLRWWFTLNYAALSATEGRDAFELKGPGVKVLSENELLTETGERQHTGKSDELNARFADWYYVVAEEVYKKIRLTRSDIVKEAAAAKDEGFGIDAFRKLEDEGPKGAPAKPATRKPMKATVMTTGPGVIIATATASKN